MHAQKTQLIPMALRSRPVRSSYQSGRFLKKRRACRSDLLNVSVIRATAATHDVEVRETSPELSMLGTELNRVANVQFRRLVELSVALSRSVRSQAPDPARPSLSL